MDEGRKRVIGIMAAIMASLHMRTADDLFGNPQRSPRTDGLIAASIQWAERIMQKIDAMFGLNWGVRASILRRCFTLMEFSPNRCEEPFKTLLFGVPLDAGFFHAKFLAFRLSGLQWLDMHTFRSFGVRRSVPG